jgi:uncharacterized membrane protein
MMGQPTRVHRIWLIVAVVLVVVYGWYFAVRTMNVHYGMGTSAYDFGLYEQGVWLLSRFESPFVTLMGRNLFGDHSSFILLFVVPLYWFVESTALLLILQAFAVAGGAIPVFLASRHLLESAPKATLFAALYLLHPAVGWTILENFHPDAFLGPLVATALWAAIVRRWSWYWLAVGLALLVKEDVALVMVPLGVWVSARRDVRRGLLTVGVSVVTAVVMLFVVMRSFTGIAFRNSWRIPFGGVGGFFSTLAREPIAVARHFWSEDRPFYLFQMVAPTAFVVLRAPSVALVSSFVLFVNVLSTFWYQHRIEYHYSLVAVPAIVIGAAYAMSRMPRRRHRVVFPVVAASALLAAILWSPLPFARNDMSTWPPDHPVALAARSIILEIPQSASVSAHHAVTAHLARRAEVYSFPNPFVRNLYGPDIFAGGDRLPAADSVSYVVLPRTLNEGEESVWSNESSRFLLMAENEWWQVFVRR